ncbi:MAG TPA: PAS domain-containing protein, partial [Chloroflexota bacterium]|nr:PAS domain-containing protein [Chloroflexota bacterium]
DAIFLVQVPSGRLVDVNESACHQLGCAREVLLDKLVYEVVDLSASPPMADLLTGGKGGTTRETINTMLRRCDGSGLLVEITVRLVTFGEEAYAVAVARDITERERLASEIRSQRNLLRAVFDNVLAGIVVLRGPDLVYEMVNAAYQAIAPEREFLGKSIAEAWPEIADQVKPIGEMVFRTQQPYHVVDMPLKIRRSPDAPLEEAFFTSTWVPMPPARNGDQSIVVSALETTEQVKARRAVESRAAELDSVISSIADGVIISDSNGQIVRMNAAAREMVGLSEEKWHLPVEKQLELLRIETPDGKPLLPENVPIVRALRGERVEGVVIVVHPPDRRSVWITASAAPVRVTEGRLLGAVSIFADITPIHDLEEQRSKYILGISHGLRTPLTVVQGQAQLLLQAIEKTDLNGRLRRGTEAIVGSAHRMSVMLRDLVDLMNLETGQPLRLNRVPLNLSSFVLELKERLRGLLEVDRVRVRMPEELPPILADPDRLERILVNLLS